jgi:hypothetical protein
MRVSALDARADEFLLKAARAGDKQSAYVLRMTRRIARERASIQLFVEDDDSSIDVESMDEVDEAFWG